MRCGVCVTRATIVAQHNWGTDVSYFVVISSYNTQPLVRRQWCLQLTSNRPQKQPDRDYDKGLLLCLVYCTELNCWKKYHMGWVCTLTGPWQKPRRVRIIIIVIVEQKIYIRAKWQKLSHVEIFSYFQNLSYLGLKWLKFWKWMKKVKLSHFTKYLLSYMEIIQIIQENLSQIFL